MTLAHEEPHMRRTAMIVEVANTLAAVREAQALRHQVFCIERKLFPADPNAAPNSAIDEDAFDWSAKHVVVRRRSDREVVATSRVVTSRMVDEGIMLPMQRYCCPSLFRSLPMKSVGEISRFAISKQARAAASLPGPALRLLLLRGILQASQSMGLTHWCALMEPSLMRLLAVTGVQFTPFGPSVEAYGQRQPCVALIDRAIATGRRSHPHYYESVAGGRVSA